MAAENEMTVREWVKRWQDAAPVLEEIREEEIRSADTVRAVEAFRGLVFAALKEKPAEPTSGLVEQQRLFQKARR